MNAHQIQNGIVVNTIVVDSLGVFPNLIEATTGGIGWLWDGETLTAPPAPEVPVPDSVTMRQACIQLELDGLLDDVELLVAGLPRIYQIEWQRASVVFRNNPLVEIVRTQQAMTHAQIDTLFINANLI